MLKKNSHNCAVEIVRDKIMNDIHCIIKIISMETLTKSFRCRLPDYWSRKGRVKMAREKVKAKTGTQIGAIARARESEKGHRDEMPSTIDTRA